MVLNKFLILYQFNLKKQLNSKVLYYNIFLKFKNLFLNK